MSSDNPFFRILDDISYTKSNLLASGEVSMEDYNIYTINLIFARQQDMLHLANRMNICPEISKQMHNDFLMYMSRKRKRFSKANKIEKEDTSTLANISNYYSCGLKEARMYSKILDEQDISKINKKYEKGGIKSGKEKF